MMMKSLVTVLFWLVLNVGSCRSINRNCGAVDAVPHSPVGG